MVGEKSPAATGSPRITLGLDLGGTSLKGGLVGPDGELLYSIQVESRLHREPEGIVDRILTLIESLQSEASTSGYQATGLGMASTLDVDSQAGRFLKVHYPYLSRWAGFPIASHLEQRCGLPVVVENDGVAMAWGEYRAGAATGLASMLLVGLGTGIGGGAVLEGQRLPGSLGSGAYFGHMTIDYTGPQCVCGQRGCWEMYASATALEQRAAQARKQTPERTQLPARPTAREVVAAAGLGDPLAGELLVEAGRFLGIGLVSLANLFNPELFVVGGGLALAGNLLLDPARQVLEAHRLPLRPNLPLAAARYPLQAGLIGAALLARERFEP